MFEIINKFSTYPKEVQGALITSIFTFIGLIVSIIYNRNVVNSIVGLKINKLLEKAKLENNVELEKQKMYLAKELNDYQSKINIQIETQKLLNSRQLEEYKHSLLKEMESNKGEYNINTEIVNNRFDYLSKTNNKLYVIRKLLEEILESNTYNLQKELEVCIKDFKNFYAENNSIAKLTPDIDSFIHPLKQNQLLPLYSKLIGSKNNTLITFEPNELVEITSNIIGVSNAIIKRIKKFDKE